MKNVRDGFFLHIFYYIRKAANLRSAAKMHQNIYYVI